jgi:hypothetical protein
MNPISLWIREYQESKSLKQSRVLQKFVLELIVLCDSRFDRVKNIAASVCISVHSSSGIPESAKARMLSTPQGSFLSKTVQDHKRER